VRAEFLRVVAKPSSFSWIDARTRSFVARGDDETHVHAGMCPRMRRLLGKA
jgi:hypothetical protein